MSAVVAEGCGIAPVAGLGALLERIHATPSTELAATVDACASALADTPVPRRYDDGTATMLFYAMVGSLDADWTWIGRTP